jgi:hypothetical protein
MLIKVRRNILLSIGGMHALAMRSIFDKDSILPGEMDNLWHNLARWTKKYDLSASEKWELRRIYNALRAEERGHFNRAKELLRQNRLHYTQLYSKGLPYIDAPEKCRTFGKL